jgi:hypothetical protein
VADDQQSHWAPFDQGNVNLVRDFLRREFRDSEHRDFVVFHPTAQVFIIVTPRGVRHMLVIPEATFEAAHFSALCNASLADALAHFRLVTLTSDGPETGPRTTYVAPDASVVK